jgi:TonB family protein
MNSVVASLEALGAAAWQAVGPLTLATALLLGVAYAVDRALERRVAAAVRVLLYLPLAVRALLPVGWTSPLGLLGTPADGGVAMGVGPVTVSAAPAATAAQGPGGYTLVALAYILVAAALLARGLLVHRRLGRQLQGAPVVPVPGTPVPVLQHAHLGPMVAGLLRPRIVVPRALLTSGQDETLALVLRHEAAHVARRDHLVAVALHALCIVAWPLLPVWLGARRVRLLMELASDERALAGQAPPTRRRYGEVLLALADAPWHRRAALVPSFGSPLAGRLRALGWRRRWPLALQLAPVVAAAGVALACAGGGDEPQPGSAATPAPAPPPAAAASGRPAVAPVAEAAGPPRAPDVIPGQAKARGSLDKEIIRRIIRRHIDEVKACYEAGLAFASGLGGRVVVRFTIGPDGVVVASELGESTLGDSRVETCIVDAARGWEFPKPEGGGVVIVAYPFSFTPNGGAAEGPKGASPARSTARSPRRLTGNDEAGRVFVEAARPTIKECYEQALKQDPALTAARLQMNVHLGPPGAPHAVEALGTSNKTLLECLETRVALVSAPIPWEGPAVVSFPVILQGALHDGALD